MDIKMEILKYILDHIGAISSVATLAMWLIKPIREKIFNLAQRDEGTKCLLRTAIVDTYYKHLQEGEWREFEFKNTENCYKAYKSLGGNSFIDHLYSEMQEWKITK